MSRELDEISRAIGRLETSVTEGNRARDNIDRKMDEVISVVHGFAAKLSSVSDDVDEMRPLVDDYRDNRSRAKGIIMMFSILAAIAGSLAGKVLDLLPYFKGHT